MDPLFNFILLIDDDPATNYYHNVIINDAQLVEKTRFFQSGEEALSFFKTIANQEESPFPELVFLDINMPVMDGWEFLDALNALGLPWIPAIVILSTTINPIDRARAESHPLVIDFLTKPLKIEDLLVLHRAQEEFAK